MMRRRFLGMLMVCGSVVLVASGCGGNDEGVMVTGSVTQGGKPQAAVNVGFAPENPNQGRSKGTRTNAEGKFEILLKPGSYKVILTKLVDRKGNVPKDSELPSEDLAQLEASGYLHQAYPSKYANPASSPLKVEIPPEGKDLGPFEVK